MAGSRNIGSLTIDLIAKIGGWTQGLNKAERDLERSTKRMNKMANDFGRALGVGIAAGAIGVAVGLAKITRAAIDNADSIRDLSIRTGIATETLSAYGYAASQTGTSIESLAKGLNILAKNAAAALNPTSAQAKIFDALGISVTDAEGKLKNLDDLIPEIATKFKGLEDGTTKTALVLKLFGRAGAELTEFLNQGGAGLEEFTAKAQELGLVIDQDTADAADRFKDTLGEVKASVGGLGLSIARELLPALQEGAEDLKDLVKQGDLAHNIVTVLSAAFSVGVGAINAYNDAVKTTGAVMDFMVQAGQGWQESVRNIWAPWSDGTVAGGIAKMKKAMADGDKVLSDIQNPKKNLFANVQGSASTVDPNSRPTDSRALARALSNPRTPKGKSGKSEAEKEADRLEKALRRMADAQREWQVELNDNGNPIAKQYADRLADITAQADKFKEDGIPTKEVSAFVDKMKELATSIQAKELKEFQDEFTDQTLEMSAAMQGEGAAGIQAYKKELKELNKELNNGLISQEMYNARVAAMRTPLQEVTDDLELEIQMLGLSAKAQEVLIAQRRAGVTAISDEGKALAELVKVRQETEQTAAAFQEFKDVTADLFTDVIQDSSNAGDAIEEWGKRVLAIFAKIAAQKIIDKIFESSGNTGGSTSGGGFWANLFTSIASAYGGGKAAGGPTRPGMFYEVNEQGPEMYSVGGRDYLMTGNQPGRVTPMQNGKGGVNLVQNFQTLGFETRRTQERKAQLAGREARRSLARNGN